MDRSQFIARVAEMRAAQREYFRTRGRGELIVAKQLEAEVDRFLRQRAEAIANSAVYGAEVEADLDENYRSGGAAEGKQ